MLETIFQNLVIGAYLILSAMAVIGGVQHDYNDQKRAKEARLTVVK